MHLPRPVAVFALATIAFASLSTVSSCAPDLTCDSSIDCEGELTCIDHVCDVPPPPRPRDDTPGQGEGEGEVVVGEGEGEGVVGEGEGEGVVAEGEGEGEGEGLVVAEGEGEGVVAAEGEGEGEGAPAHPQVAFVNPPAVVERGTPLALAFTGDSGCTLTTSPLEPGAFLSNGAANVSPNEDTTYTLTCASSSTSALVRVVFADGLRTEPAVPTAGSTADLVVRGPRGGVCVASLGAPAPAALELFEGVGADSGTYRAPITLHASTTASVRCELGGISLAPPALAVVVRPRVEGLYVDLDVNSSVAVNGVVEGATACDLIATDGTREVRTNRFGSLGPANPNFFPLLLGDFPLSSMNQNSPFSLAMECTDSTGSGTQRTEIREVDGAATTVMLLGFASSSQRLACFNAADVCLGGVSSFPASPVELGSVIAGTRVRIVEDFQFRDDVANGVAMTFSFPRLEVVVGNFGLTGLPDLQTLGALDAPASIAFPRLRYVGRGFSIFGCSSLRSAAFPALDDVGGNVSISFNSSLRLVETPAQIPSTGRLDSVEIGPNAMPCSLSAPDATTTAAAEAVCRFVGRPNSSPQRTARNASSQSCSVSCP